MSIEDERLKKFHKDTPDPGGNGILHWNYRVKVWTQMIKFYKAKKLTELGLVAEDMLKFAKKQQKKYQFKR